MKIDSVANTIRNQIAYEYAQSQVYNKTDLKKTHKKNYWREAIAGSVFVCAASPILYRFGKSDNFKKIPEMKTSSLVVACLSITAMTAAIIIAGYKIGQKVIENHKNRTQNI